MCVCCVADSTAVLLHTVNVVVVFRALPPSSLASFFFAPVALLTLALRPTIRPTVVGPTKPCGAASQVLLLLLLLLSLLLLLLLL